MAKKVTKIDIVGQFAKKAKISQSQADEMLNCLLEVFEDNLVKDRDITLTGFGTFHVSKRKARKGINPQNGKEIDIPASKTITFRCGATLKNKVNK